MLLTDLLHVITALALGFSVSAAVIPSILKVAKAKSLFDPPDDRKLHTAAIPPLGGIAIFMAFNLSVIFSSYQLDVYPLRYIFAAVILMFFIGLKDDMINISARKKFAVQVIAVFLLIFFGENSITNLHGFLGFYEIPFAAGCIITFFVMLSIINAFNLIDGIDGLASGLAIMASAILGLWFFLAEHLQYAIIAFGLAGSLAGFFLYNVFGKKNKLFLGDTGSLVVGIIIAALIVQFNKFNIDRSNAFAINAAPAISFAIVMLPLIDTLRVMSIRILSGRSPFSPDKNHIHHRLLELFPGHLTVTLIMVSFNLLIIFFALLLNNHVESTTIQFMTIFLVSIIMSFLPSQMLKWRQLQNELKSTIYGETKYSAKDLKINNIGAKKNFMNNV